MTAVQVTGIVLTSFAAAAWIAWACLVVPVTAAGVVVGIALAGAWGR